MDSAAFRFTAEDVEVDDLIKRWVASVKEVEGDSQVVRSIKGKLGSTTTDEERSHLERCLADNREIMRLAKRQAMVLQQELRKAKQVDSEVHLTQEEVAERVAARHEICLEKKAEEKEKPSEKPDKIEDSMVLPVSGDKGIIGSEIMTVDVADGPELEELEDDLDDLLDFEEFSMAMESEILDVDEEGQRIVQEAEKTEQRTRDKQGRERVISQVSSRVFEGNTLLNRADHLSKLAMEPGNVVKVRFADGTTQDAVFTGKYAKDHHSKKHTSGGSSPSNSGGSSSGSSSKKSSSSGSGSASLKMSPSPSRPILMFPGNPKFAINPSSIVANISKGLSMQERDLMRMGEHDRAHTKDHSHKGHGPAAHHPQHQHGVEGPTETSEEGVDQSSAGSM